MIARRLVRRPLASAPESLPGGLHPVLRRVYAARGVRGPHELELGLEHLLPVFGS